MQLYTGTTLANQSYSYCISTRTTAGHLVHEINYTKQT